MSSCLTCRHARKPKDAMRGFAFCVFSGSAVAVSHVCTGWERLGQGEGERCNLQRRSSASVGFGGAECEMNNRSKMSWSPSPYNSRGTSAKLAVNGQFFSHCEMQNTRGTSLNLRLNDPIFAVRLEKALRFATI